MSQLYHVDTQHNPADLGTRPSKVKLTDVGPDSIWELGCDWMKKDIQDAITEKILIPSSNLRLKPEMEEDFNEGIVLKEHLTF